MYQWSTYRFVVLLGVLLHAMRAFASDPVLTWNRLLLDAVRVNNSPPTSASRNLAILHTAIYDSVNSIQRTHQPYRHSLDPTFPASEEAAVYGAAHAVLVTLLPQHRGAFDSEYQQFINNTPATPARSNGLSLGNLIGLLTVDSRSDDGSTTQVPYIPSADRGQWQRTPPDYRSPLDPHWRFVEPFCVLNINTYVVPPPPALSSSSYAAEVEEVYAFGALNNSTRTSEQDDVAVFWSDFNYTATPPGHWQEIATTISTNLSLSLSENARLFALLSLCQADSGIVAWEGKYRHNFWRPITAIHRADEDGNSATIQDTNWTSFITAPPFPEYPSGHSTFSMASAVVIANFLGTDAIAFDTTSESLPGVVRSFSSLTACADEVGVSRIYGGIHFENANQNGKNSGARVATYVSRNFLLDRQNLPLLLWEVSADGFLQLRVHGEIGSTCIVERATDVVKWSGIVTNNAVVGGFICDPMMDISEVGFFRVRAE